MTLYWYAMSTKSGLFIFSQKLIDFFKLHFYEKKFLKETQFLLALKILKMMSASAKKW